MYGAGQIGYALCPQVARGAMLGPDQPIILHLLDIEPAKQSLEGVKMELIDAAFPLLQGKPVGCLLHTLVWCRHICCSPGGPRGSLAQPIPAAEQAGLVYPGYVACFPKFTECRQVAHRVILSLLQRMFHGVSPT